MGDEEFACAVRWGKQSVVALQELSFLMVNFTCPISKNWRQAQIVFRTASPTSDECSCRGRDLRHDTMRAGGITPRASLTILLTNVIFAHRRKIAAALPRPPDGRIPGTMTMTQLNLQNLKQALATEAEIVFA